ncbi:PAS domain S-box protein [Domibacillus iocasae]
MENQKRLGMLNEELLKSKQQLQTVFNNIDIAVWCYDERSQKIPYTSKGMKKITGYPSEQFIDRESWKTIIHPDDVPIFEASSGDNRNGISRISEYRIIHADGHILWIQNRITPTMDPSGKIIRLDGVVIDITSRKEMETALVESEAKNRFIVENIADLNGVLETDGTIRYAFRKGRGSYSEDVEGASLFHFVHPEDLGYVQEIFSILTDKKIKQRFQFRFVHAEGYSVFVECMAMPIISNDGEVESIVAVARDVTEQEWIEKELKESEKLNRLLVELSPEAIIFHYDYKCIYINSAALVFIGASSAEDIIGRSIFDFIHPDFQKMANSHLKGVYEQQTGTSLLELKMIRKDQTVIDVEAIVTPISYMGKNAGFSLIRDVTKQKKMEEERNRAEQKIRESEERYSRLQKSLDRFSHDLFGIMKVSELNRRFVKEVQNVIKIKHVSVIEVQEDKTFITKSGNSDLQQELQEDIGTLPISNLPVNELIETLNGYLLKIGENSGKNYLLYIGGKPESLTFPSKKVWLKTVSRYINVLYDNFRLIEDLTKELDTITSNQMAPAWLLRLLFKLSENERKHLSQDLHDSALQEQIIWYRKLNHLSTDPLIPPQVREQLQQIGQGLLDVIYQIRITCNELRPPMLKEEGLVSSLEALFEFTQLRANYSIQFDKAQFYHTLTDDLLIGLYRIVQELLANATKHSGAAEVHITLASYPDRIKLVYRDDGIGMDIKEIEDSFNSMGVYGVQERVRSMDGKIDFHSLPNKGLTISISLPALLEGNHINLT